MNHKQKTLEMLKDIFNRWEALSDRLSEDQITMAQLPSILSIKDVIAHLRAWQQVSIARLEAARADREPVFPTWLGGLDPEAEENIEQYNARIYETYSEQPWSRIHTDWRSGFLRFLELGEAIPEPEIYDQEKYPWLKGYALLSVLEGSYEHHREHLESVLAWLHEREA